MALNAYLSLTGQKSGPIKGSVILKGRENSIAVYSVEHEIVTPRDAQSGLPTGQRMHKPLIITKETDKSSPLLMQMLVTNENVTDFILHFYTTVIAGPNTTQEVPSYTIRLTNANIASVDLNMRLNKVDGNDKLPMLETISFTYQKIEWTWIDGGIITSDSWQTRV